MNIEDSQIEKSEKKLHFYGGYFGALIPFVIFIVGVIWIALSGAPDERGFWPILILALAISLLLSKDKKHYSDTVIRGMSQSIVMIMITAWMLASIIGVLMTSTGFVDALTWMASQLSLSGTGFVIATLVICSIVSLSTGSSFATILICGPILYPAGGVLGADLATLAGAIIGGATFGDFFAPISDTTIASALSQKAEIGPTVRSRLKYIIPAVIIAIIGYVITSLSGTSVPVTENNNLTGSPAGLPMILVPVLIIFLFLRGKHLLHGLLLGLVFGTLLGIITGLLPWNEVLSLDKENFVAKSFIIDGMNRAVGISFFTILLMGLVSTLTASGIMESIVAYADRASHSAKGAERWIAGMASAAVLLTTHSVVAILTISEFANRTGEKENLSPIRRSNIMSLVVCVFPFILPYFIPVILMANTTNTGEEFGIPTVNALQVGLHNFVAWGLAIMTVLSLMIGYGRKRESTKE